SHRRSGHGKGSCPQHFHDAEVRKNRLAHRIVALLTCIEQNISRLDIAVNDALLMCIVNGEADRREEAHELLWREKASSARGIANILGQRLAFNVIHDHISQWTTGT